MEPTTLGDRAQLFQMRQRGTEVKSDLLRLGQELSSGRKSDLGKAVSGDFSAFAAIERGLNMTRVYQAATDEAALFTGALQSSLEAVQSQVADLAPALLSASGAGTLSRLASAAADAGAKLDFVIGTLNTQIAGRALFSGDRPQGAALIDGAAMLAELAPLVATSTTPAQMLTTLEDWFLAPGGGFETIAYLGGDAPLGGFTLAPGDTVATPITALAPELREALMALALSALVGRGAGPQDEGSRRALMEEAGLRMLSAEEGLANTRADIGSAEARIEAARVRNTATETSLTLERNRLTGADPFATATELEAVQLQLETLFLLTARLSRLNLAEFLR